MDGETNIESFLVATTVRSSHFLFFFIFSKASNNSPILQNLDLKLKFNVQHSLQLLLILDTNNQKQCLRPKLKKL